ncbi:MAG: 1-deoxy-D-xylulose-5-phosphate synthase, partial [Fibrobacterota bacterium]|nr:1-deoxy-D-xylulose-5-phosphate synthase [Fibrobacterota bacterium]
INPTVVDARFAKPLDRKAYSELFARHRAVLTIEDNVLHGGYGHAVSSLLTDLGRYDVSIGHISLPDEFVTHGEIPVLHKILGMDAEGIQKKAVNLMGQVNLNPKSP